MSTDSKVNLFAFAFVALFCFLLYQNMTASGENQDEDLAPNTVAFHYEYMDMQSDNLAPGEQLTEFSKEDGWRFKQIVPFVDENGHIMLQWYFERKIESVISESAGTKSE